MCGPVREEVVLKGRGHVTTRPSWWGRYVIYHEVVATSQNFMRQVCAVEADWRALPPPPPTPHCQFGLVLQWKRRNCTLDAR